jgi:hypothetical protein
MGTYEESEDSEHSFVQDFKDPEQLYNNIENYPELEEEIKDDFGEVTISTCQKAINQMADYLIQLGNTKPEYDREEHMLDSEEREWRDAFDFIEELTGDKAILCDNCDTNMTPETGEARISRDGLLYKKCSMCGEEVIDEELARYKQMQARSFLSDDEKNFLERHSKDDGYFWPKDGGESQNQLQTPNLEISSEIKDELEF